MSHPQCVSCHKLISPVKSTTRKHRCGLGRKRKKRKLNTSEKLGATIFKPQGIPSQKLKMLNISATELEVLKLKNIENLHQIEIAKKMSLSQSTLARIIKETNKKITLALVNNWGIKIN